MRRGGSTAACALALLTLLGGAHAGETRSGFAPSKRLLGAQPAAPMNLLPPPALQTTTPPVAAPRQAVRRRSRAAKPKMAVAPLPRPRPPREIAQEGAAKPDLAAPGVAVPGRAVPGTAAPGPVITVAAVEASPAKPPPPAYPEILVPDFDALKRGDASSREPRTTGSVRPAQDAGAAAEPDVQPPAPGKDALPGAEQAPAEPLAGPAPQPPAAVAEASPPASSDEPQNAPAQKQSAPPPDAEVLGQPYELVRTLQALQDQIAGGSTAAFEAQRTLLTRIDAQFAAAPPETWKDKRNAYALVTFVLSGGPPAALRRLLAGGTFPAGDEKLMRGALAYVEGRAPEAREQLAEIDARQLPGSMGAQVALAQAALSVAADPGKALSQLDTARLLAPGTLVEEAALRREILVASDMGDTAKFQLLSRQYLSRFRHSVYAGNFRQRFAAALTRMDFMNDEAQFPRLDELLVDLDPPARLEIYLTVARASAVHGNLTAARLASERALALAEPGAADAARARLYRGSALVVAADGLEPALEDLQTVDTTMLTEADRALFNAASVTATSIQTAADPGAVLKQAEPAVAEPETEQVGEDEAAPVVARAKEALAAADTLLEEALK